MLPRHLPSSVLVALLLGAAMMLRILPLSSHVAVYNPDWVLLCLIYWCMALPERFGVLTAWVCGLAVDVITGQMLGQHALAYSVVAYLCIRWHRQLRHYSLLQQTLAVLGLLLTSQLLVLWTQHLQTTGLSPWHYWLAPLVGALMWPFSFVLLRALRRRFIVL